MKSKDVVIGMAVIPHDKTAGYFNYSDWLNSEELTTPPVLLVERWDKFDRCWELTTLPLQDSEQGGMFNAKDFEPYTTPSKVVRFNRLIVTRNFKQYFENGRPVYRFSDFLGITNFDWDVESNGSEYSKYILSIDLKDRVLQFETVMDRFVYIDGRKFLAFHIDFGNLIEEIK